MPRGQSRARSRSQDPRSARWQCAGARWGRGGPALVWRHPAQGERLSPLTPDRPLSFTTGPRRACVGVRRSARHTPCPAGAEVPASAVSAQCPDCARLDRSYSVAADTRTDDPRPYDVYLAWFGAELVKVGITAAEREGVRLLEQAALSYCLLGRGPLMAARRAEAVLGTALGVPDRFPYAAKRTARESPPPPERRAADLAALHQRARALGGLPESLALVPCEPVHHDVAFHLDRVRPAPGLVQFVPEATVSGRIDAVAGPDIHLTSTDGRALLLDARQLAGWPLTAAEADAPTTAPVARRERAAEAPEGLF
ncbi:hypothetical protein VT50_0222650 [Streptomyces antioxidans]|uniref:DUF2797 domain-containing protein n=1 Tax=Streptomyces antioxidans TaxID=1507734 RepID=A0A1V4D1Q8_9ACTN|nr:DUF2797 domain-containing protein [Streptomyces antioxidans]OPF76988.1 hypothetical protein VT50_0222650 [Streptomyces antioxidans]